MPNYVTGSLRVVGGEITGVSLFQFSVDPLNTQSELHCDVLDNLKSLLDMLFHRKQGVPYA